VQNVLACKDTYDTMAMTPISHHISLTKKCKTNKTNILSFISTLHMNFLPSQPTPTPHILGKASQFILNGNGIPI
jgi:hypothetical protein